MSFTGKAAGWLAGRLKGEKARKKTMNWMKKTGVGQLLGAAGDAALIGGAARGAAKGLGALKGMFTGGAAAASSTGGTPRLPFDTANAQRQNLLPNDLIDSNPVSAARESAIERATGRISSDLNMRGIRGYSQEPGIFGSDITRRIGTMGEDVLRRGAEAPSFGDMGPLARTPDFSSGAAAGRGAGRFLGGLARGGASAARGAAGLARGAGGMLRNPQVLAAAAGGIADVIGSSQDRAVQEQQLRQQDEQFQQRFNVEDEERKRQQAQANRLASFFVPTTR